MMEAAIEARELRYIYEDGTAALEQALRDATSANADMEIMDTQFMGRRIK